ncbi:MAG: preprotein translocase subunit YajC [Flavobacteriales bacterium]|nr:preprotein translocase subunit YajC [Flavobacteriales bacterium]|tara:strand:+ start:6648 stop:6914 length:267 start_codon:yes stop_codon:yes gene_type:complete
MESLLAENIWLFWVAIFFIFWFFIIRPKVNAQKKEENFRKNLESGQKIITIGGIHGKIIGIKKSTVLLEIEGGNKIKVNKTAILSYKE